MEIRSVTLFIEPSFDLERTASFIQTARQTFTHPVQSTRLALTPLPSWWDPAHFTARQAVDTAEHWQKADVDYVNLGPVQLRHDAGWLNAIPEIIASSDILFVSVEIADTAGQVDVARCWALAGIIQRVSRLRPDGLANLYLAALANCPAGSPFFPVAYHRGGSPHFALAVEAADLALEAIRSADTLTQARQNIVTAIEDAAVSLAEVTEAISDQTGIPFSGIDFSLAPAPGEERSLGGALEGLGLSHLGAPGSLFAATFVAEAIGRAEFKRCGFSGLMLPVLEDSVVAARAGEGQVTVSDLLSYSAVCGAGLDTIPLPGNIGQDELAAILLDVAALAARLGKPLTARLLPLPGLSAGDPVDIDFPYFTPTRVMGLAGPGPDGLLRSPARLTIISSSSG